MKVEEGRHHLLVEDGEHRESSIQNQRRVGKCGGKRLHQEDRGGWDIDYFDYDLVCIGFPSYEWQPPKSVTDLLKNKLDRHRKEGRVRPSAPKIPGKNVLIFCTYSGPHTGINEATPSGKYVGQFFEHIGFTVLDEWYVLSEFHGWEEGSTKGRMGDIRGKPTEDDLRKVREDAKRLAEKL